MSALSEQEWKERFIKSFLDETHESCKALAVDTANASWGALQHEVKAGMPTFGFESDPESAALEEVCNLSMDAENDG